MTGPVVRRWWLAGGAAMFALALRLAAQAPEVPPAKAALQELLADVQAKLMAGQQTERELATELLRFDTLGRRFRDEKTEEAAEIPMAKAMLYFEVFNQPERGVAVLAELQRDFPGTAAAKRAGQMIRDTLARSEAKSLHAHLAEGGEFPGFTETDMAGRPLALAEMRGKVVLVSFWAAWSNPSRAEVAALAVLREKFRARGFEIVGVSLDRDRRDAEKFLAAEKIPWRQIYDGNGWNGKLAQRYSVVKLPTNYLLDGAGRIIARNLRGTDLAAALEKALPKPVK